MVLIANVSKGQIAFCWGRVGDMNSDTVNHSSTIVENDALSDISLHIMTESTLSSSF